MRHETRVWLRSCAVALSLICASGAFAKSKQTTSSDLSFSDENNANLGVWDRNAPSDAPQDLFGDSGPRLMSTDGVSNDPNWPNNINE